MGSRVWRGLSSTHTTGFVTARRKPADPGTPGRPAQKLSRSRTSLVCTVIEQRLIFWRTCLTRPSMTSELHWRKMKGSLGPMKGWPKLRNSRSKPGKGITIKSLASREVLPKRRLRKLTRPWPWSGTRTSTPTRRRRKWLRRSLWTSLQPKKFLLMTRREQSTTLERILLIPREEAVTIPSTDREDSISPAAILLVADPSSSSFISTENDLEAFTQTVLILQLPVIIVIHTLNLYQE